MVYLLVIMICSAFTADSFELPNIHSLLTNSVNPVLLRKELYTYTNHGYQYVPYTRVKKIMHDELNMMDLYGNNNDDKNLEHVFPQYSFKNDPLQKYMKSDIHNLYLCNKNLNSARQNFKYTSHEDYAHHIGESVLHVSGKRIHNTDEMFQKSGYLMIVNRKTRKFIPTQVSRGKIARALGYFVIKYDYFDSLHEVIDVKTLLEWNLKDPVTNEEYYKNIIGYKHQNNINPFILQPDLLSYCFADIEELDPCIIAKARKGYVDPMFTVEKLLSRIQHLESMNKEYLRVIQKFK